MNPLYKTTRILFTLSLSAGLLLTHQDLSAQCGSAQGNPTVYGTNNTWIGYIYQGKNFDNYYGYVNEGSSSSPNFDESFGGDNVSYATNGCSIQTENFSARYRLTQAFAGNYSITVGGDDGYRLSLDGGSTWVINNWNDHGYTNTTVTLALNGTYNLVLDYYENGGANRVTFNMTAVCLGTGDPTVYGTGNIWQGYLYQGMNFDMYKGSVTEGSASNANFDENFGNPSGSNTATYNTNSCSITTYQFSARYRLQKTLTSANYVITVGGDDGFRLSLDGGSTWVINRWNDQSYTASSYNAVLSGTYNMVLEFYQNGGFDRVSFQMTSTPLPITLTSWSASVIADDQALLKWQTTNAVDFDHFIVQRSTDGELFSDIHTVPGTTNGMTQEYSYTDQYGAGGKVFYRLLMVDRNGAVQYSNILSMTLAGPRTARIYPTVIDNGNLFIQAPASIRQAKLELFDMNGRKIREKTWSSLEGRQQVSVNDNGNLPAGAYLARLSDNNSVLVKQIVLVK